MAAPFFSITVSVGIPDSTDLVAFDRRRAQFTVARPTAQDGEGRWEYQHDDLENIACAFRGAIDFAGKAIAPKELLDQIFFEVFWLSGRGIEEYLESNSEDMDDDELKKKVTAIAKGFLREYGKQDADESELASAVSRFTEELWSIRDKLTDAPDDPDDNDKSDAE